MEENSQVTSYLVESLNGIETVKAFNSETKAQYKTLVSGGTVDANTLYNITDDATTQLSAHNLFDFKWTDYTLNDQSWLRADTFSWQDGTFYSDAYNHLVDDYYNAGIEASTSETISGTTIWYRLCADGHKVCPPDQESNALAIYNATGVAWYYILDTANTRFKLPRTKYGFTGYRDTVGKYVPETLPDHRHSIEIKNRSDLGNGSRNAFTSGGILYTTYASESNSTYQDGAPVQQRATQMYLYFYVGQFSQSATEQTAGINAELFNGKVDLDGSNATFSHVIETQEPTGSNNYTWYRKYSNGWVEQGGKTSNFTNTSSGSSNNKNVTFPIEMDDARKYSVLITMSFDTSLGNGSASGYADRAISTALHSTTGFTINQYAKAAAAGTGMYAEWIVIGKSA